jgi:hypothetical protein
MGLLYARGQADGRTNVTKFRSFTYLCEEAYDWARKNFDVVQNILNKEAMLMVIVM